MRDVLNKQTSQFEHVVIATTWLLSQRALGFHCVMNRGDISYNVSRGLVIANASPLGFLGLTEQIMTDGVDAAISRLDRRLAPLFRCNHRWDFFVAADSVFDDSPSMVLFAAGSGIYVCKYCTAYALSSTEGSLPLMGRNYGRCATC